MQPKAGKLGVIVKVQERTVFCGVDAGDESARGWRGCDAKKVLREDVGGGAEIKNIELPVFGLCEAVDSGLVSSNFSALVLILMGGIRTLRRDQSCL